MIFSLDTNDYENIKITLTDNDYEQDLPVLIEDFCYAMASFFVDFSLKLNCDTKQAEGLKEVILDCTGRNIEFLLKEGVLDNPIEEELEENINELINELEKSGFSEAEISNIIQMVNDCGSIESAGEYLKQIASEAGIDIDDN